ncbi:MAG TPA: acetamidase/formamidase family protein [Thermoanaerobaculia bacterium]|nr:acetamidase/formamidase family protein [Thermoanaerobaculia bacterium]
MRRVSVVLLCLVARVLSAEGPPVAGRWVVTVESFGVPAYYVMTLQQQGEKLTGDFDGDKLEGTVSGNEVKFRAQDERGGWEEATARLDGGTLRGSITLVFSDDAEHPRTQPFTARRATLAPAGSPRRHEFVPTTFHRQFSPAIPPVLTIAPGDTVHTTTVDAGGTDEKGTRRVRGGNPQTGPFAVDGAAPGDTLVVKIEKLRLNRDYAISDDGIVDRGLDSDLAVKMKDAGNGVRWHLDAQKGIATPEKPSEHLARYAVPVRPMLGCVAVAPPPAQAPPGTGDSGRYGGNMDFNEIVEGVTLYLPVSVPGALLYVGDGHAAQGDGELTGDALETSMDVEFTVDVIPGPHRGGPRMENATHIMAMGLDGSIDGAFKSATSNMASWLFDRYKLTPSEVGQVLGTAAEYRISEVADRNAGVVLKISKERLATLAPPAK